MISSIVWRKKFMITSAVFIRYETDKNFDEFWHWLISTLWKSGAILKLGCLSFRHNFCSISCKRINRILLNYVYVLILTRSSLELLHIIIRTFVKELWPFTDFRSISWKQIDRIWPHFVCVLILTRSRLWLLSVIFPQFVRELWWWCQNFVSSQYFENKWTEFHQFFFRSISWERIDRIWPNIICAFILARSRSGFYWSLFTILWHSYGPQLFLQHEKRCCRALVRSSENSSSNKFCYFPSKTYVESTQKYRLNETTVSLRLFFQAPKTYVKITG